MRWSLDTLIFSKMSSNDVGFVWMDDQEELLFLIEPLCKQETLTETRKLLFESVLVQRGGSSVSISGPSTVEFFLQVL